MTFAGLRLPRKSGSVPGAWRKSTGALRLCATHRWQPRAGRGKEGSEDFFPMDKKSLQVLFTGF